MKLRNSITLFAFVSCMTAMTFAQNRVSYYSVHTKKDQPIPDACKQQVQVFESLAVQFPHPKTGWSFIIVCDNGSWTEAMQHVGFGYNGDGMEHYGETNLDAKTTLFRGDKLIHPDMGAAPEHIVAHELAHIMLDSRDEEKVDNQALAWIDQQRKAGSVVAAVAPR